MSAQGRLLRRSRPWRQCAACVRAGPARLPPVATVGLALPLPEVDVPRQREGGVRLGEPVVELHAGGHAIHRGLAVAGRLQMDPEAAVPVRTEALDDLPVTAGDAALDEHG